jgi:hypothetical protein
MSIKFEYKIKLLSIQRLKGISFRFNVIQSLKMSSQLPTIFNSTFLTSGLSKGFFEFITKVGEARSKQVTKKKFESLESIEFLNFFTKILKNQIAGRR